MRLRNIPRADEILEQHGMVIKEAKKSYGKWNEIFANNAPVRIEIGMGKGKFLLTLAMQNPDVNYIGIERYSSVLLRAVEKLETEEFQKLKNVRFICMDAAELPEVFEPGEVDRIYLNFSDPWPKERHARRRLTSKQFLSRYNKILAPDGQVEFKTDNRGLFDFSVEQVPEAGWDIAACTYDLHQDASMNQGNVMTEYEEKFSQMGNPIHKLTAKRKADISQRIC